MKEINCWLGNKAGILFINGSKSELEKKNVVDKKPPITRIELVLDLKEKKASTEKKHDFFSKKVLNRYHQYFVP